MPATFSALILTAAPLRNPLAEVDEGGNPRAFHAPAEYMQILTPQSFALAAFNEIAKTKKEPHASAWKLLKGSPLNVRIGAGGGDAHLVKTMINMLPKPMLKSPNNTVEDA